MEISRGDVVLCVVSGDYGKIRPAVVVQADLYNPTHASVVICPLTTYLVDAPFFRIPVQPEGGNGLHAESQVMVDKVTALRRERLRERIGRLGKEDVQRIDHALREWLGLDL